MTGLLFDLRPVALAQEPEPARIEPSIHASGQDHPDVLRILSHKAGGFTELRKNGEGQVIGTTGREFRILELQGGRFLREWSDGVVDAAPPAVNAVYVADGIRFGTLVEVAS